MLFWPVQSKVSLTRGVGEKRGIPLSYCAPSQKESIAAGKYYGGLFSATSGAQTFDLYILPRLGSYLFEPTGPCAR